MEVIFYFYQYVDISFFLWQWLEDLFLIRKYCWRTKWKGLQSVHYFLELETYGKKICISCYIVLKIHPSPNNPSIYSSIHLFIYPSSHPSICSLSFYPSSNCPSIHSRVDPSVCPFFPLFRLFFLYVTYLKPDCWTCHKIVLNYYIYTWKRDRDFLNLSSEKNGMFAGKLCRNCVVVWYSRYVFFICLNWCVYLHIHWALYFKHVIHHQT